MDAASRNQRLRETLEGMGLFVLPVPRDDDPTVIDYLEVSAGLPSRVTQNSTQDAAGARITKPVPGAKIGDVIPREECGRENVVNFPAIGGSPVTVVGPIDNSAIAVDSPE